LLNHSVFDDLLISIAFGVAVFFFRLLFAMNGFSESDTNYGLGAYILLAILVSLLMSNGVAGGSSHIR